VLEKLEEIRATLYKYLEVRIDLVKTETQEKAENAAVQLIYVVVLMLLASLAFIFLFIMLAIFLNELLDSRYWGFVIVFGVLVVMTFLWVKSTKNVQQFIRKLLFRVFN
jgi:ABC-type multidrug transport system permease subunit